ncbi:hypothetical protein F4553_008092 [Allocatelliglobosispora scoriae]|uniref:Uncharacterized protein n=1 Tax=Allocatelliglobosispora scoriae TaxID=643052 RepID=A0A841C4E8_9ACTN|nr:hypothetical protein [Allocatelliglobosispora scoriae]MBB5866622.1 hypothetical protein [Allocatelliglobosispora scoriae]MBB5874658.1 hypothetical protein [Allocatelliglobosispora scoriae]
MTAPTTIHPAALLPDGALDILTGRLHKDHPDLDLDLCARIQRQSLEFLAACASNPGTSLTPSVMVDLGWHNLILHTEMYAAFCDAVAGRFIHHYPYDGGQNDPSVLDRTKNLITAAGYTIDEPLWALNAADCGNDAPCGSHAR